jgi:hypothetical protein
MQIITVTGPDISSAWLAACQVMYAHPHRIAYHTVVRIENPLKEDPSVRRALDQILDDAGLQRVSTVANTIFPVALACSSKDHLHLSHRYEDALPSLRRLSRKNDRGTYFERLIAFPGQDGPVNQLDAVISRLRREIAKKGSGTGAMTAAYEVGFNSPGTDNTDGQDGVLLTAEVPVRVPGRDRVFPGFPCLSHCSFQLDRSGALHAMAHYRSQRMVERAYGNYLGLGRLLGYIAEQTELEPGELTVTAGYAEVDQPRRLRALLRSTSAATAA